MGHAQHPAPEPNSNLPPDGTSSFPSLSSKSLQSTLPLRELRSEAAMSATVAGPLAAVGDSEGSASEVDEFAVASCCSGPNGPLGPSGLDYLVPAPALSPLKPGGACCRSPWPAEP